NREKAFNISYTRLMSQHEIIAWDSKITSSLMVKNGAEIRTHGVQFDCIVRRAQSRILYSNVIPALSIVFFDAYIYITNRSPLYCLLPIIILTVQIQFFSALLVNKLPYLVMLIIARTFLSIFTSFLRILFTILNRSYPLQITQINQFDSPLTRLFYLLS
ncbi:hypothetical protein PFISCL1PPCAC_24065, partial [Pristionchus fissidentatus]